MFVHQLKLYTKHLDALRRFYREILGFHFEEDHPRQITLPAGHSRLTFSLADQAPYYLFAFNIPSDQSGEALHRETGLKKWACTLLQSLPSFPSALLSTTSNTSNSKASTSSGGTTYSPRLFLTPSSP